MGPGLNASLVLKKEDSMEDTADWEVFELTADHGDTEADKIRSFTTYRAFITVEGKVLSSKSVANRTNYRMIFFLVKNGINYVILVYTILCVV